MRFVDEWPGPDIADRIGHTPGAGDCPCGPWVTDADSDNPDEQVRNIRHVEMCGLDPDGPGNGYMSDDARRFAEYLDWLKANRPKLP